MSREASARARSPGPILAPHPEARTVVVSLGLSSIRTPYILTTKDALVRFSTVSYILVIWPTASLSLRPK